jgi:hypothetical protein
MGPSGIQRNVAQAAPVIAEVTKHEDSNVAFNEFCDEMKEMFGDGQHDDHHKIERNRKSLAERKIEGLITKVANDSESGSENTKLRNPFTTLLSRYPNLSPDQLKELLALREGVIQEFNEGLCKSPAQLLARVKISFPNPADAYQALDFIFHSTLLEHDEEAVPNSPQFFLHQFAETAMDQLQEQYPEEVASTNLEVIVKKSMGKGGSLPPELRAGLEELSGAKAQTNSGAIIVEL